MARIHDVLQVLDESSRDSPERKLIAAVLERAVSDLFSNELHIKRSARQWFSNRKPEAIDETFSFYWCLDQLDLFQLRHEFRNKVLSLKGFMSFRFGYPCMTKKIVGFLR